jgi:hypothetical protein
MIPKIEEIRREIAEIVIRSNIPGLNDHSLHRSLFDPEYQERLLQEADEHPYSFQSFSWERAWGVSCRLTIKWDDSEKMQGNEMVPCAEPTCGITWSTMSHDIVSARSAILLYTEVVDLATMIQSHYGDRHIESVAAARIRVRDTQKKEEEASIQLKKDLIPDGTIFDILKDGTSEPRLPFLLYGDPIICNAKFASDPYHRCEAKAKQLIWSKPSGDFTGRCGRHRIHGE